MPKKYIINPHTCGGHLDVLDVGRERSSRRATDDQVVHDRSHCGAIPATRASSGCRLKRVGIAQSPKNSALPDALLRVDGVNEHAILAQDKQRRLRVAEGERPPRVFQPMVGVHRIKHHRAVDSVVRTG